MKTLYWILGVVWMLNGALYAQNSQRRTTSWDGNLWSKGVPDGQSDVIIAADFTSSEDLHAYNLTVYAGKKLDMIGTARLVLTNEGFVQPGGEIVLSEESQFVQKNSALTPPTMTVYRKTGYIFKYDYTYFSSPVSGQVINDITAYSVPTEPLFNVLGYQNPNGTPTNTYDVPLADKYFTWNPTATPAGTDSNLYSAGAWQNIPDTSVMANDGKGYIVRGPNSFPYSGQTGYSAQQWWVKFSGTPNAGTITRAINGTAYTPYAGAQTALPSPLTLPYKTCNDGLYNMNLIGNPYPSMLDADTFLTNPANVSAIDGAIYMWSHNSGPSAANPGNGTQIYNYTASDYVIYNLVGGVGTGRVTGDPVYAPDDSNRPIGKIAVCQGFFVRGITNGAGVATFNPDMQDGSISDPNDQQFYRGVAGTEMVPSVTKNRFWLSLSDFNNANNYRETLVGYMPQRSIAAMPNTAAYTIPAAVNGYDKMYDTEVIKTVYNTSSEVTGRLEFYTMVNASNPCPRLAIQGRVYDSPFNVNDVIPLGFSCPGGKYTIKAEKWEGQFGTQKFWVRELLPGGGGYVFHEVRDGIGFTFSTAGESDNTVRFQIVFKLPVIDGVADVYCNTTLSNINQPFQSNGLPSDNGQYRWWFVPVGGSPSLPNPIQTSTSNFSLANPNIPAGFIDFGKTYCLKVGVWNNSLSNWVYSSTECCLTTPARVIKTGNGLACGSTVPYGAQITCSNTPYGYSWLVYNGSNPTPFSFTTTLPRFNLTQNSSGPGFPAGFLTAGGTYCIQVATVFDPNTTPPSIGAYNDPPCCFTIASPRPAPSAPDDDTLDWKAELFPNPYDDDFNIVLTGTSQPVSISIYDLLGQLVEHRYLTPDEAMTDGFGRDLPTGVYMALLTQGEARLSFKVVKK